MVAGTMESRGTWVGNLRRGERGLAAQHIEGGVCGALVDAEPGAGIALRIEIDDEHALADGRERGAEIDGGGGLADAAFLVGEGENARAAWPECVHGALASSGAWAKLGHFDDMRACRGQARVQAAGEAPRFVLAAVDLGLLPRGLSRTAPWFRPEERRGKLEADCGNGASARALTTSG